MATPKEPMVHTQPGRRSRYSWLIWAAWDVPARASSDPTGPLIEWLRGGQGYVDDPMEITEMAREETAPRSSAPQTNQENTR